MRPAAGHASSLLNVLGLLGLVAALLLSLPGVRAVRADEPDMTPVGVDDFSRFEASDVVVEPPPPADRGAESCGDPAAAEPAGPSRTDVIVQLADPLRTAGGAEARQAGPILLNNRGYNYGSAGQANEAELQRIEQALQAAGR